VLQLPTDIPQVGWRCQAQGMDQACEVAAVCVPRLCSKNTTTRSHNRVTTTAPVPCVLQVNCYSHTDSVHSQIKTEHLQQTHHTICITFTQPQFCLYRHLRLPNRPGFPSGPTNVFLPLFTANMPAVGSSRAPAPFAAAALAP